MNVFVSSQIIVPHLANVVWFCGLQRGEDLESGMNGDVESKYKKMYEDDINPFTAFSKKVRV